MLFSARPDSDHLVCSSLSIRTLPEKATQQLKALCNRVQTHAKRNFSSAEHDIREQRALSYSKSEEEMSVCSPDEQKEEREQHFKGSFSLTANISHPVLHGGRALSLQFNQKSCKKKKKLNNNFTVFLCEILIPADFSHFCE